MPIAADGSKSWRLVDVLRGLESEEGQAALAGLCSRMRGVLDSGAERLEESHRAAPRDRFERAVATHLLPLCDWAGNIGRSLPAALHDTLAEVADAEGQLSAAAITKHLGPQALAFMERLAHVAPESSPHQRNLGSALRPAALRGAAKLGLTAPELPALAYFVRELAQPDELAGFHFLGLQHLFMSSASLFEALAEVGIPHDQMRLLGKCYSTSLEAVTLLRERGAHVDATSFRIGVNRFDKAMESQIRLQLRAILSKLPHPPEAAPEPCVLIIDDGAEAIRLLHEEYPEYAPYFVCVEQTRRGARVLRELERQGGLRCAVANVAETFAKLEWESPMIGHSVALEVTRKLDDLAQYGVEQAKEAVVLGYGAVGRAVAAALANRGFSVHVHDPDPARRAEAERAGLVAHSDVSDCLGHARVLVSCVGTTTLREREHQLLPDGAILFNAASADDELKPDALLCHQSATTAMDDFGYVFDTFGGRPVCLGHGEDVAHCDHVVRMAGKEYLLVNRGFVVNMTGEADPIPPRYIQLTRALLFLGAIAARRAKEPGLIDVPPEWQTALIRLVQRDLAKTREQLQSPAWERRDGCRPLPKRTIPGALLDAREKATQGATEGAAEGATADPGRPQPALRDGEGGVDPATAATAGSSPSDARVFGYLLGPVAHGSMEAAVNQLVGSGDGVLSVAQAALHAAAYAINAHFGMGIRVSTTPAHLVCERVRSTRLEEAFDAGAGTAEDQFVQRFSHNLLLLMRELRANHPELGLEVAPGNLSNHVRAMASIARVPVERVIDSLGRSPDADDRSVAAALANTISAPASTTAGAIRRHV